jgi:hypothetical protein
MSLVVARMTLYFKKWMIYNTLGKLTKAFTNTPQKKYITRTRPRKHGCVFCFSERNNMEIAIYCPKCKRKVGTHDGRSTIPKVIDCRKCRKRVIYTPENGTVLKDIPKRNTSSGVTFH